MKELSLQFKGLNTKGKFFLLPVFFFSLAISSCKNRSPQMPSSSEAPPPNIGSTSLISVIPALRESWIEIRPNSDDKILNRLRLNANSCINQKLILGTSLLVLGQEYDIGFEEDSGQIALALVEDSEIKINSVELSGEIKDAICASSGNFQSGSIKIDDQLFIKLTDSILAIIPKLVPDCKTVTFEKKTVRCNLESMSPQTALTTTEDFQKAMIRTWSRQPYILARRTGVISTLARTATNFSDDEAFVKFCRILQFSLPEELPIIMTSHRWQSAFCSGQAQLRQEAAYYGLSKGTQELALLRELYEGTSRVGLLSVKIPHELIPGTPADAAKQPIRVTIAPDQEVSLRLVDQAKKYLGRPDHEEHPKRLNRTRSHFSKYMAPKSSVVTNEPQPVHSDMCWHPVFGESWSLLRIADGMKLTGAGYSNECGFIYGRDKAEEKELAALSLYLQQSLTSETEFVMDNGQSKLLRLPEGKYQYTVHALPANPLDLEDIDEETTPKSSGELGWGTAKNHAIKSW